MCKCVCKCLYLNGCWKLLCEKHLHALRKWYANYLTFKLENCWNSTPHTATSFAALMCIVWSVSIYIHIYTYIHKITYILMDACKCWSSFKVQFSEWYWGVDSSLSLSEIKRWLHTHTMTIIRYPFVSITLLLWRILQDNFFLLSCHYVDNDVL